MSLPVGVLCCKQLKLILVGKGICWKDIRELTERVRDLENLKKGGGNRELPTNSIN